MFSAVGLHVGICRYEVLQTWFCKNAYFGCEMVLQAKAEGGGELPWRFDGGLVTCFVQAIYIVIGLQRCMDGYLCHQTCAAINAPCFAAIYVAYAFHWYAKIVYRLPLFYLVAILAHLKDGA